ncbi:MAG: hypothetical protein E6J90_46350 [Deltaproteobacteria bacterium]|nr:MAG: hypothetical protein E6J90_46350 [Deltaproteobacteria bacterium]
MPASAHRGADGARWVRRLIEDHGVKGFKFHPSQQQFYPNDRLAYPLYEVIKPDIRPLILKQNAIKLLGLAST